MWFVMQPLKKQVFFTAILTLNVPCISESCIEMKIKLNFYFHTSLCASKGFMKAFKVFVKIGTLKAHSKVWENFW